MTFKTFAIAMRVIGAATQGVLTMIAYSYHGFVAALVVFGALMTIATCQHYADCAQREVA